MKKKNLLLTFLIAATFLLGGGGALMAQTTVTIGSGTTTSATYPTTVKNNYSYTQQIYTADEIGGIGSISSIAFYATDNDVERSWDIYLVNTEQTSFNGNPYNDWIIVSNSDKVFSGNISFTKNTWTTISISTFAYTGNNLAVIVHDHTGSTATNNTKFRYYSSSNYNIYAKNGETDYNLLEPGQYYRAQSKNQIQLSITIDYPRPATLSVSGITNNSANISWTAPTATAGHTLSGYQYRYKADGDSWTSETATETTSCSLNSLTSSTDYTFQVRAVYTDSSKETHYSFWTETTYTTDCDDLSIIYANWNFDASNSIPDCWRVKVSNNNGYPKINTTQSYAHSGKNSLQFNGTTDQIILLPAIEGGLNGKTLIFYAKNSSSSGTKKITVGYYNASGVFTKIKDDFAIGTSYPTEEEVFTVDFSNLDGVKKVAIKGESSNSLYLDDIVIVVTSSCTPVSSPTVGTVTYNSAQLSWTAGDETNWKLQYRESGEEDWTTDNVSSANLSAGVYTLSGLSENATYEWQVAAWCDTSDDDDISTYVAGEDFSTPAQYPMPTDLAADNITANSADITWTAGSSETAWQLSYTSNSELAPEYGVIRDVNTTPSYSMTGLTRNTTYYVYVRANYGDDHYSSWTAAEDFTTECGTFALPYSYDFEDPSDLDCWTLEHAYSGSDLNPPTGISYDYSHSSSHSFKFQYGYNYGSQYLISPELSGTSLGVQVELYHKQTHTGATISIGYSTTNNASGSFTWIAETTNQVHDFDAFKCYCPFNTKYVAIRLNSTATSVYIDDISFTTFDKVSNGAYWYNSTDWNPVGMPSAEDNVYIQHEMTIPNDCIAVANNITLGPSGSLTIADGGQLICNNSVQATLEKEISGFGNDATVQTGWYTIASPSTTSYVPEGDMLENNYDLYYYDETGSMWYNYKPDNAHSGFGIEPNKGYLYANSANTTLSFTGGVRASNASVSIPLSWASSNEDLKGFNLVGNPFTYNLTDTTNITIGGSAFSAYYIADGTADDGKNVIACEIEDRSIKPGEGFFVQATAASQSLVFNGRGHGEKQGYIRIMAGNEEFTDRAYVQFGGGNTLRKMTISDNTTKMYLMHDGKDYAAATIEEALGEMPVCFKAAQDGQYTITVNPEEVEMGYLHLVDNIAGTDVDLLANPSYTFNAKADDYESRFRLVFVANANDGESQNDFAFISNGSLIVTGEGTLQIFDILGHQLFTKQAPLTSQLSTLTFKAGVYVLRLIQGTDVKTQKIIVK